MNFFLKYKEQYKANLKLAFPVMLTQLGQILVQVADNLMVGRYGAQDPLPLAAVSFGGSIAFIFFLTAIGLVQGLTPIVGEHFARGEHARVSAFLHNGLIFFGLMGFVVTGVELAAEPLAYYLGQPHEVVVAAMPYYRMLAWSMIPLMFFFVVKQFLEGVGNTTVTMVVTILSNVLNVILNWVFIFGRCGAPELGVEGAGLATLIARCTLPVMILVYLFHSRYRHYMAGFRLRLAGPDVRKLCRVGLPISAQMFLETSAFVGSSIMMGWFDTESISANQIALTTGNCSFMMILSISAAATIRVSHCYGMRDMNRMTLATKASYHLSLVWTAFTALCFVLGRHFIPSLFTENEEVIRIAGSLLIFAALYQLSDGVQNVSVGILRGIQDVKVIMPIAFTAYWILNLPIGYLFAFVLGMGPSGIFLGYSFGLSAAAALMILRIRRSFRRLRNCKA